MKNRGKDDRNNVVMIQIEKVLIQVTIVNNYNICFNHFENNQPCKNFCNLRRQHLLWKMHKNINPSYFEDISLLNNQSEGLAVRDKICATHKCHNANNNVRFLYWKMDVVNFYSIDFTEISESFEFILQYVFYLSFFYYYINLKFFCF